MNEYENGHTLRAEGLHFAYRPGKPVLAGVDFRALPEKLVCVLGPNGSGKSTLLRCLMGWLGPQAGQVLLDDQPVRKVSRRFLARTLAYVPQTPQSAFAFSALELVLMGRFAHGGSLGLTTRMDLDIARAAMQMTHTEPFEQRTLDELSGGEAQCVMIARALAQQPAVMLLDEPTSHLDIRNQLMIYRMMRRLAHDWKMAVVCVSHDINLAARFADELILMREGRVVADGPCRQVITREILEQVYGVAIELVYGGRDDLPFVAPGPELGRP